MLINDAKPSEKKSVTNLRDGLKILADETNVGKIDRKIVRALFKVAIDDIEYEISARMDYVEYLKSEIKRVKVALRILQTNGKSKK